jgi:membrane protein involved in colicin uptake
VKEKIDQVKTIADNTAQTAAEEAKKAADKTAQKAKDEAKKKDLV